MHLLIFSAKQLARFWSPEAAKIVLIPMGGWIPITVGWLILSPLSVICCATHLSRTARDIPCLGDRDSFDPPLPAQE
jgi:hypothetical protein